MTGGVLIALAVAAGGPAASPAEGAAPDSVLPRSLAVYPAQRIPLAFDHRRHLAIDARCELCHDAARRSASSLDVNLPHHPECAGCHEIEKAKNLKPGDPPLEPPADCLTCHPGFDATVAKAPLAVDLPGPNLRFPHDKHVARGIGCGACHPGMAEVGLATRDQLPRMETCLACHDGTQASSACSTCHPARARGAPLTVEFPNTREKLRPAAGDPFGLDHGVRFDRNHGARARMEQDRCAACHAQSECLACHDGTARSLTVHPNDYAVAHPVQARQDSVRCDACHRRQTFCIACHERAGLGRDADPAFRAKGLRVHPDFDVWVRTRGPQHHAVAASRDIGACASCHREDTCMSCHSATRVDPAWDPAVTGFSPHPPGFKDGCRALAARNSRVCAKCHAAAENVAARCR